MRTLVIIFFSLPVILCGQIHYRQPEEIKIQVNGNIVTLSQDTVFRNCGALYNMKVGLVADTLYWIQEDTGSTVGCDCRFDLSIMVDSLSTGNYIAKVYYTEFPHWPPPYPDTVYVGSVAFEIANQNFSSSVHPVNKSQSDCFFVGEEETKNEHQENVIIYPNPARDIFTIERKGSEEGAFKIYDFMGRLILKSRITNEREILDITDYIPGIYLIKLENEVSGKWIKFIKQ
jgi:hypothetical protein